MKSPHPLGDSDPVPESSKFPVASWTIASATGGLQLFDTQPKLCSATRREVEFVRERGRFGFSNTSSSNKVPAGVDLISADNEHSATSDEASFAPAFSRPRATQVDKSAVVISEKNRLSRLPMT